MARKLTEKVSWVGKIDWELKRFHGDEYSTHRGSSYNAYLIRDRKTVLIDTAWLPFDHEFVNNLKREIDLKDIDAIVMQHNEVDHSGALPALMTTTVPSMAETIRLLRQADLPCKVVVGGAVLTQEYASQIGADRYSPDAMATVRYAREPFGQ